MLPEGVVSTQPVISGILPPRDKPKNLLVDYDLGPVDISDPSQGLMVKTWIGSVKGGSVTYSANGVADQSFYSVPTIDELSITFDQNGRPCFAFCDHEGSHLFWFNTLTNQYEVLDVGVKAYNPRVILDDKRPFNIANSDVLFFYILGATLYVRYQRERFITPHALYGIGSKAILKNVGMNKQNRIQIIGESAG